MIIDNIKNASRYENLSKEIKMGLDWLKNFDKASEPGKYEIDGKNVYASVQSYESKLRENANAEYHKVYADIQYLVSGEEIIYIHTDEQEMAAAEYLAEKDVAKFKSDIGTPIKLSAGDFILLYPDEAHQPGCCVGAPAHVDKVVIKIKIN